MFATFLGLICGPLLGYSWGCFAADKLRSNPNRAMLSAVIVGWTLTAVVTLLLAAAFEFNPQWQADLNFTVLSVPVNGVMWASLIAGALGLGSAAVAASVWLRD